MKFGELLENSNPMRKAGHIFGKLESVDKTSREREMIADGEESLNYSFYLRSLDREIVLGEDIFPGSFMQGYRQAMREASYDLETDYSDLFSSSKEYESKYRPGD